jgi:hypothetical protein
VSFASSSSAVTLSLSSSGVRMERLGFYVNKKNKNDQTKQEELCVKNSSSSLHEYRLSILIHAGSMKKKYFRIELRSEKPVIT